MRLRLALSGLFAAGGVVILALPLFWEVLALAPIAGGALLLVSQVLIASELFRKPRPAAGPNRIIREAERGRRLAIYDPVSGLLARWYFELRLLEETQRSKRYGLPLVVLTLTGSAEDGDDEVSALGDGTNQAAQIASSSVRRTDFVGSIGFSGFAICLIHCDRRGAEPLIRRLMKSLGDGAWRIGMAVYPEDDYEGKDLIDLATRRSAPWRTSRSSVDKRAA